MEQHVELCNFTAGELSPRLKGRIDLSKYFNGADTLLNMVVMPQGGTTRRPGTLYVANQKDQANRCLLRRFVFSTVQAYMLEFSNLAVRIYKDDAVVLSAGLPVDVVTPYNSAQLAELKFTQSADTLFIWHPDHPPATLTRSSHTSWTYAVIVWRDGPYENINTTATTLTPSGTTGPITVTASSIVGINVTPSSTGQGFLPTDIGRLIRIKGTANWGWVMIVAPYVSTTVVNAVVQPAVTGLALGALGALDGVAAAVNWRLGRWSATTGYPYAVTFWQQRLVSLGYDAAPNAVVASVPGDFTNMAPSQADSVVTSSHAVLWIIDDDQVNAGRWLSPAGSAHTPQLGIGTTGGEQILQAASSAEALTPTSVQAYRETSYGSAANVEPLRIGRALLFVDRSGRKIREWSFYWQLDGYNGPDITQLSEHITAAPAGSPAASSGIRQMSYQQTPHQVVWANRNDGGLIGFTYDRDQQVFAPHRHQLGGSYYGGPPQVESHDVIPAPDGTYDEVWLSVLRTINGVPKRFIEVMTRYFDVAAQDDAFFVDAGLSSALNAPAAMLTISGLTNTAPATMAPAWTGTGTFEASAPVLTGLGSIIRVAGGKARVTQFISAIKVTAQVLTNSPLQNVAPAAAGSWSCTPENDVFSGLGHLEGETVALLGDGAVFPSQPVSGGAVSLGPDKASFLTAGLPYTPVIVTMSWESNRATAAASQGRVKRADTMYIRFDRSLGCSFGRRLTDPMTAVVRDKTEPLQSRTANDPMSQAPPLFSGIKKLAPQGGADQEGQIIVVQPEPLPLSVLAIFARGDVGEIGG